MICQRCGNNIPDGSKFCQRCGNMVAQSRPQQYPIQNKPFPQPQIPSDNGKKKDNVKVKILAIVLAGLILIVGLLSAVAGINSKKGIPSDALHVKDFPVLKRTAVLSVYDEEIFPAEEYEIKVEKYNMGGAFKNLGSKEVVLRDETTEPTYELELEDGDYRVTLTDTTERAERETTSANNSEQTRNDVVYKDIVLEVRVDDDDEDAVDNAGIRFAIDYESLPPKETDFIEATEEDFELLRIIIGDVCSWSDEYKPENPDANKIAVNSMLALFNDAYRACAEKYGLVIPEGTDNTKAQDPLKRYISSDYSGFYKYPEDDVNWLVKNMFNVNPKETESWETYSYPDGTQETVCLWYNQDGYYYSYFIATGADVAYVARIDESNRLENGTYIVSVTMLEITMYDEDGPGRPVGNYEVVAGLKEVDGKRVWSLKEWKRTDGTDRESTTAVPEETTEPTTYVGTAFSSTPYSIWEAFVTNEWVDEDEKTLTFTQNTTYYKFNPSSNHTTYDYYMGTLRTNNSKGFYYGHYHIDDDYKLKIQFSDWPNGSTGILLNESYVWDPSLQRANSWCMTSDGKIMFSNGDNEFSGKIYSH